MSNRYENATKCEVRGVIRFLHAKKLSAVEIYRQMSEVYGKHLLSESEVQKWCREFSDGRTNTCDEDRRSPSSPL